MTEKPALPAISDDAMIIMGSVFAFGPTALTFHMRESKPSDRLQAALNELVAKDVLATEAANRFGGITYKPRGHDLKPAIKFARANMESPAFNIPMTQPI